MEPKAHQPTILCTRQQLSRRRNVTATEQKYNCVRYTLFQTYLTSVAHDATCRRTQRSSSSCCWWPTTRWSTSTAAASSSSTSSRRYTWSVSHLVSSYHTHSMMPTSSFWRQYLNECTCMYIVRSFHFGIILSWCSINQRPNSISSDIHWFSHIRSVRDNCSMNFNFVLVGYRRTRRTTTRRSA